MISFFWIDMLWLLAIVPLLVVLYIFLLRRKKKLALRYANLSMVRQAMGAGATFRRHVPPLLFLISLTLMIAAVARPAAVITLPSQRSTVILAMDVSGSMLATDIQPDRLQASKAAAKAFIEEQPRDVRIGVVAFAASALLVQAPTFVREDLFAAIDRLATQRATAIGSGILVSLKTLFPDGDFDMGGRGGFGGANGMNMGGGVAGAGLGGRRLGDEPRKDEKTPFTPVPAGSNGNAVVILLTDGQATTGPDPVEAAKKSAERGVRIFTVGLGSPEGTVVNFGGRSSRVQLDEETLQKIADSTRGSYFRASTAGDLKTIYKSLNSQLIMETKKTEITAFFCAAAAAFAILAASLSLLWFNRIL
ncbi:MAG: VWA domain-containing protein [Rhodospirillaceae bacterium]|nr:VWA domain-containing protein [Rhodospirillaceae bacterium]